jgi:UDP-hydrolysing UDP-N-acetyl-D-glucosamine 2-epimerase
MRSVLVVTVGRSDYGIYRPLLERMRASSKLNYRLLVSGGHLSRRAGHTVEEIEDDAQPVAALLPLPDTLDSQAQTARAMATAMFGMADHLAQERPDIILVLGDRFEMFAIAAASVPFNIPIAHIHGGELSFGAIDDAFRHAITKMAHLHFASTAEYAGRIIRMGEEPWRVTVSGAPALDNLLIAKLPERSDLEKRFGISLEQAPLLVTFHPVTRRVETVQQEVAAIIMALRQFDIPIVFTAPNVDAGSDVIRRLIQEFCQERPYSFFVESFGALNYLAMLRYSAAMLGNSSSGLIETPSFMLPTVNVGDRQQGRTRARNVIDVEATSEAIAAGLQAALDPSFRAGLAGLVSPYGDGHAADRIVKVLEEVDLDAGLLAKRFYDGTEQSA